MDLLRYDSSDLITYFKLLLCKVDFLKKNEWVL